MAPEKGGKALGNGFESEGALCNGFGEESIGALCKGFGEESIAALCSGFEVESGEEPLRFRVETSFVLRLVVKPIKNSDVQV